MRVTAGWGWLLGCGRLWFPAPALTVPKAVPRLSVGWGWGAGTLHSFHRAPLEISLACQAFVQRALPLCPASLSLLQAPQLQQNQLQELSRQRHAFRTSVLSLPSSSLRAPFPRVFPGCVFLILQDQAQTFLLRRPWSCSTLLL